MRQSKRKKVAQMLPLSPKLLGGIVLIVVVVAVLLIPSQRKLLESQLSDQDWEKARQTLAALTPEERAANPAYYDLLELQLTRRTLKPDDLEAFQALLPRAIELAEKHDYAPEFVQEIEQLAARSLSARETYEILKPYLPKLPIPTQNRLYESLAKAARAQAEPILAAEIYGPYWRRTAGNLTNTFHYVQLLQGAGSPAGALQALEYFERTLNEPLYRYNHQMAMLKVDLLQQNNQPVKAFELLWQIFTHADPERQDELFDRVTDLAAQAGMSNRLLDVIRERARRDQDAVAWRHFARQAVAAGDQQAAIEAYREVLRLAPKDGASALALAQLYTWNNAPDQAFDAYLQALQRGEAKAIDKLIELNKALFRDVETFNALVRAGPLVDHRKYGIVLARLAAKLAEFDRASSYYDEVIAVLEKDPGALKHLDLSLTDVLQEYGLMMLDIGHHEKAIELYRRSASHGQISFKALVSIAEAQFRAGHYEAALKTYRQLLHRKPERRQLENYLRLAESMGRIDEAAKVLREFMDAAPESEIKDYQKLAYFYGVLGNQERLTETLRQAVQAFPDNLVFRKQLLYAYSDSKRNAEAAALLATFPDIASDKELTQMYVGFLMEAKRFSEVEEFITNRLTPEQVDELKLNELLASVYYETGNKKAALALYEKLHRRDPADEKIALAYAQFLLDFKRNKEARQVLLSIPDPSDPLVYKTAAQLFAADKEYRQALRYQKKYLSTHPKDAGRDWGFLGDILGECGDKAGQRRAYRRAISEMLATLARIDATNAPTANATAN